jgi:Cys-Gly metallodipeptidase DUG1
MIVSKLVTPDGQILVTGVKDLIAPVTEDERKKFEAIHFDIKACFHLSCWVCMLILQDIQSAVGAPVNIYDDVVQTVSYRNTVEI